MRKPKSFNDVCASADSNRLSSDEYKRMIEHVELCPSCHAAHEEFSSFLEQLPAEERGKVNGDLARHVEKGGLQKRFIARARVEGIRFSPDLENRYSGESRTVYRLAPPFRWAAAAAVLAMIVAGIGYHIGRRGSIRPEEAATQAPVRQSLAARGPNPNELEAKLAEVQANLKASKEAVSNLQDENTATLLRIGALEKDLGAGRAENQALQKSLTRLSDLNAQLASQNDHSAQLLARTQAEIEGARVRRTEMEAEIAAERAEVSTLSDQLKSQTATITQERELLAAGRDIRDLMGARNLHIVDVHDVDARGKKPKSFGRIFYTEGKSLIFYAYDLDERKLAKANYSFEVWGERLGEPTSVRNLGILYTDNKAQRRWALKIDDPQQLAEIDSVFVTLQRHEPGSKPLGQRILFAFLGGNANHP